MSKWSVLLSIAVLAACASPEERTAQWQGEVDHMMRVYGPACERLGYKRDDDKWRDCVLRLSQQDESRYSRYPTTTSCFGGRGFFNCMTF